ncbi:MAG: hypothetical protein LBN18_06370 [Dysgonamonadaceae bacterium]|jgi:hypothetical protein|nr:hypothetical protein [Dysgonamonadaceae bacterium]
MESQEKVTKSKKKGFCLIAVLVLILGLAAFVGIRYYYPFGEGVKTGQLNYVVYKGYIFKTYEGKLIQAGFKSADGTTGIQSNEFVFSISNKAVAERLMLAGGQQVDLHYTEYMGALPWRGHSTFVVDSIISIKP